jgi:hypothetical protein
VDKCSDAYKYGKYIGDIAGIIVGGRLAKSAIDKTIGKKLIVDGISYRNHRLFQLRLTSNQQPIFRIDWRPNLHYHRGFTVKGMKKHRPYDGW